LSTIIIISRPPGINGPEDPGEKLFEGDVENASQREEAHKAIDRAANLID